MRGPCLVGLCLLAAAPAAAQPSSSTYVGASLIGEIVRSSRVETEQIAVGPAAGGRSSADGETLGFALSVGRALASRWGVELEYARSGEIEHVRTSPGIPLPARTVIGLPPGIPIPSFEFESRTAQQRMTIGTAAWVRQDLGARVSLSFLGGISFSRVRTESHLRVTDRRLAIWAPFIQQYTTIDHHVGPVAGAETHIRVADHAALTAGVRLHGAGGSGGWMIRPGVGIRWLF